MGRRRQWIWLMRATNFYFPKLSPENTGLRVMEAASIMAIAFANGVSA